MPETAPTPAQRLAEMPLPGSYGPQQMRFNQRLADGVSAHMRNFTADDAHRQSQERDGAIELFYTMVNADMDAGNERREFMYGERNAEAAKAAGAT